MDRTPTPLTNAACYGGGTEKVVPKEFAEKLEQEIAWVEWLLGLDISSESLIISLRGWLKNWEKKKGERA